MPAAALESVPRSLTGAWSTLKLDPVGILLPAIGLLLLEVATWMAVRHIWPDSDGWLRGLWVAALMLGRAVAAAPLRALMLHAGARAMGLRSQGWRRSLALLGVHLVVGPLAAVLAAGALLPAVGLATVLGSYGWFTLATATVAIGVAAATALALLTRAVFAYAPIEAVVRGRSGASALRRSALTWASRDRLAPPLLLLIGDTLVALGGLCCGAGALPGYPLSDLALLHRWHRGRLGEVQ